MYITGITQKVGNHKLGRPFTCYCNLQRNWPSMYTLRSLQTYIDRRLRIQLYSLLGVPMDTRI